MLLEQTIEDNNKQRDLKHLQLILDLKGTGATVEENKCMTTNKVLGIDYIIKMTDNTEIWVDVKSSKKHDFKSSFYFETRTKYCDTGNIIDSWAYEDHTKLKNHWTAFTYDHRIVLIKSCIMRSVLKSITKNKFKYRYDKSYRGNKCIKESIIITDRELLNKLNLIVYDFIEGEIKKGDVKYLMEVQELIQAYTAAINKADFTEVMEILDKLEAICRDEELIYKIDEMLMKSGDPEIVEFLKCTHK